MAGRKKKPFTKKPNVGRPFDKQGRLADLVRALSGQKMPFTKMKDGGAANKTRSQRVQDTLQKGMISKIRKKALAGEKDEFGIPFTSHYKAITGKNVEQIEAKNMKEGGKVPAKFKGFSKLPEEVQMKMNPQAAKKYKSGGAVMSKRGGSFKGTR